MLKYSKFVICNICESYHLFQGSSHLLLGSCHKFCGVVTCFWGVVTCFWGVVTCFWRVVSCFWGVVSCFLSLLLFLWNYHLFLGSFHLLFEFATFLRNYHLFLRSCHLFFEFVTFFLRNYHLFLGNCHLFFKFVTFLWNYYFFCEVVTCFRRIVNLFGELWIVSKVDTYVGLKQLLKVALVLMSFCTLSDMWLLSKEKNLPPFGFISSTFSVEFSSLKVCVRMSVFSSIIFSESKL